MPTEPTEPAEPTVTRTPEGCTDASPTCTVASRAANGVVTTTVTTNMTVGMTHTRTVTVSGTTRTITTTDTKGTEDTTDDEVTRVEMLTCTGGENCVRMSRADTDHSGDSPVTTTIMYSYSSSRGGRIETTETSTGTLMRTFSQYEGGDPVSTVFTHTGGLTVTTMNAAGMRVETTYATTADAMAGANPMSMRVGPARTGSNSGFMPGETVTRTEFTPDASPEGGRTLVATEYEETIPMMAGDEVVEMVVRRTYITARDASGRETERRTVTVANNLDTLTLRRLVETEHPATDDTMPETVVTTTEYDTDGTTVTRTTIATTDEDGEVETIVRNGPSNSGIVTTTVTSSDGLTVATTYGPGPDAGNPAARDGETDTVVTNAAGTEVVTTTSTGTGGDRAVSMVVTRDEAGAETMRVQYKNMAGEVAFADQVTRETITTAHMPGGGSTVTTVTATRADADSEYMTGNTVVVTNDAMGREVLRVTTNSDNEETERRVSVYAADGARTETRTFSGGEGDMLMDVGIREWNTEGALVDDVVFHPGVQSHAIVTDEQYTMIQTGLAPRPNSKTVMGQATLHLDYDDDDAFDAWVGGSPDFTGDTDLEVEMITRSPDCTAGTSCTYSALRAGNTELVALRRGEWRLYNSAGNAVFIDTGISTYNNAINPFWHTVGEDGPDGWNTNIRRTTQGVLLRVLSDLLGIGGAGLSTEYTPGNLAAITAAPTGTPIAPTYNFTASAAAMDAMDRNTYTYLTTAELPRGVMGIGRQVKQVDSYLRLADADLPAAERKVAVKVENYFGWMANSMFTVRRVTAENADGGDWEHDDPLVVDADPANRARALVGMVSGDPSIRPELRREAGMTDPGTWSGSMIGVGTIQGERYRGNAKVSVDFAANDVSTQFTEIQLDQGGVRGAEFGRFSTFSSQLADDLTDADGITFRSTRIEDAGGYTSTSLTGVNETNYPLARRSSSLQAQFYGPDAAEVAGTFNAIGLALGGQAGDDDVLDNTVGGRDDLTVNRGDIVGAFGATRDPMTEAEDDN